MPVGIVMPQAFSAAWTFGLLNCPPPLGRGLREAPAGGDPVGGDPLGRPDGPLGIETPAAFRQSWIFCI